MIPSFSSLIFNRNKNSSSLRYRRTKPLLSVDFSRFSPDYSEIIDKRDYAIDQKVARLDSHPRCTIDHWRAQSSLDDSPQC